MKRTDGLQLFWRGSGNAAGDLGERSDIGRFAGRKKGNNGERSARAQGSVYWVRADTYVRTRKRAERIMSARKSTMSERTMLDRVRGGAQKKESPGNSIHKLRGPVLNQQKPGEKKLDL